MSNGFQSYQGYGSNLSPELQRQLMMENRGADDMQLASQLASLPNSELGYEWLNDRTPQGQMISGQYVAPNMTQYLASAAKQGLGGLMVKRRGDAAKALAEELARKYGSMSPVNKLSPHEM